MKLNLATDIKTRTGAPDKDARLKNAYVEVRGDQSVVRKRPIAKAGIVTVVGVAQGGIDGFVVNGDVLIPIDANLGGYAIWNEDDKSSVIYLDAEKLQTTTTIGGIGNALIRSSIGKSSGKWYYEVTMNEIGDGEDIVVFVGVATSAVSVDSILGADANGWNREVNFGFKLHNNVAAAYGSAFANGNVAGVALNMDDGEITIYKNGVSEGVMYTGLSGEIFPCIGFSASPSGTHVACDLTTNFGASAFAYSVPSGYNSGLYE